VIGQALGSAGQTGVSWGARVFILLCGLVVFLWVLRKLRRRELLVPICSMVLAVGLALVCFAVRPTLFDAISYAVGVKYPPLLYLILIILWLVFLVLHLAIRLSAVDARCRRLAQEIALMTNDGAVRETTADTRQEVS